MSASAAAVALQLGSSRRARAVAVWFSLDQHGPEDTRGLGGERDHHDLVGSAREQIPQPRIADPARSLMPQIGACAADQQRPQHAVTLFGDAPGTMLAAGAVIAAGHVWTAPSRQELFGVSASGSGSGHVYGLEMRPVTAGPDGDRGSNSNHCGALLRAMTRRSVSIPVS